MIASIGILVVTCLLALYEVPKLLKKKLFHECLVFMILLIIGFLLNIVIALRIPIPNPVDWIIHILQPVSQWIDSQLQ